MNGFDAVLSREDLLSRVFAGGESGLRVREIPFLWRDGRLTPNLADVAPTVSYDVKIDSAYERLDFGSLGGPSKNGPDQGGDYCFWLSTAHASGMSGRQIQLQAQDHKARCAPLANQIAKAFGTEKDFGATNVSADTECMCVFVHLCGRDLLLYHITAKVNVSKMAASIRARALVEDPPEYASISRMPAKIMLYQHIYIYTHFESPPSFPTYAWGSHAWLSGCWLVDYCTRAAM